MKPGLNHIIAIVKSDSILVSLESNLICFCNSTFAEAHIKRPAVGRLNIFLRGRIEFWLVKFLLFLL